MVPGLRGLLPRCVQRGLHGSVDLCMNGLSLPVCFLLGFAEDALFVFNLQKGKSGACLVWHQQCPTSSMLDHANVAICLPTLPLGYHVMMMFWEGQVMHLLGLTFHQELLISASITQHMAGGGMCVFVGVWVCADAWQMKGQHQLGPPLPARATSVVLCLELRSPWNSM